MSILLTASESASAGSMIPLILMYVVVFGVFFYFVLYRPQKKEQKKTSAMLSTLEIGDCVLTTSGFYGIVIDITDDTVIVEFGNNKTAVFRCRRARSYRWKRLTQKHLQIQRRNKTNFRDR